MASGLILFLGAMALYTLFLILLILLVRYG